APPQATGRHWLWRAAYAAAARGHRHGRPGVARGHRRHRHRGPGAQIRPVPRFRRNTGRPLHRSLEPAPLAAAALVAPAAADHRPAWQRHDPGRDRAGIGRHRGSRIGAAPGGGLEALRGGAARPAAIAGGSGRKGLSPYGRNAGAHRGGSNRWAKPCVRRSTTMARATTLKPASKPRPTSIRLMDRSTSCPMPRAPIMDAITTIANAIMVVWL